jgi:hypothetical protein
MGKPPWGKNGLMGFFLPESLMLLHRPSLHKKKMVVAEPGDVARLAEK